jgi:hypothetical protein
MPRMSWTVLLGTIFVCVRLVAVGEPLSPPCGCHYPVTCHSGPVYSLSPGCCESRHHCFDNAWDGYCQERARRDAFWCKVGTGGSYSWTPYAAINGRGVILKDCLRPVPAACECQGSAVAIPGAQQ